MTRGVKETNLNQNSQLIGQPAEQYSAERSRAFAAVAKSIANGDQPASVASVVLTALTNRNPRLRYPGGRKARFLMLLRKFAPQSVLDRGLRKQFGLAAA